MMFQEKATRGYDSGRGAIREGVWGVMAGVVGSLCCIGPSAAVLLGLGSSSALFSLQIDHTLAFATSSIVLSIGCVLALRHVRTCAVDPHTRWRQITLMLVVGVLTYGLLGMLLPWAAAYHEDTSTMSVAALPASSLPPSAAAPPSLRRATLLVAKMDCPPCAAHLHNLW